MLREPEDGERDRLGAAAVGGNLVKAVVDGDAVAGAVDGEVLRQRHTLCINKLVEEAFIDVFVDLEVLDGTGHGRPQYGVPVVE